MGSSKSGLVTHGLSRKNARRFYDLYYNMLYRCSNPKATNYYRYGGRGITCWSSFLEFADDMHETYAAHVKEYGEADTTLDRIDSNKNYTKDNCRWATRKENYGKEYREWVRIKDSGMSPYELGVKEERTRILKLIEEMDDIPEEISAQHDVNLPDVHAFKAALEALKEKINDNKTL